MTATGIRDRAAIVGIGQTPFAKHLGRSEYDMALEAILAACADAGLSPRDIDGTVRYDMESTDEECLRAALGNPDLRWFASSAWGGGGSASVLVWVDAFVTGVRKLKPFGQAVIGSVLPREKS